MRLANNTALPGNLKTAENSVGQGQGQAAVGAWATCAEASVLIGDTTHFLESSPHTSTVGSPPLSAFGNPRFQSPGGGITMATRAVAHRCRERGLGPGPASQHPRGSEASAHQWGGPGSSGGGHSGSLPPTVQGPQDKHVCLSVLGSDFEGLVSTPRKLDTNPQRGQRPGQPPAYGQPAVNTRACLPQIGPAHPPNASRSARGPSWGLPREPMGTVLLRTDQPRVGTHPTTLSGPPPVCRPPAMTLTGDSAPFLEASLPESLRKVTVGEDGSETSVCLSGTAQ